MDNIRQMRPRKPANRGLEPNLHPQTKQTRQGPVVYYRYKHPITGEYTHWGPISRREANAAARVLNDRLLPEADLIGQVMGAAGRDWNRVLDAFEARYPKFAQWSARTAREHKTRIKKYRRDLGARDFATYPQDELSAYINGFTGDGRVQNRNLLIHVYRFAVAEGYCAVNLAENTLPPAKAKRQRDRLTLEQFRAIHKQAPKWLQCAMDLSLVTLQSRAEIAAMRQSDVKGGFLYVVRNKTKERTERAYIRIQVTPELQAVIRRCKWLGVPGPWMIRRHPERRREGVDGRITVKRLSNAFAEARDATGLFDRVPAKKRPTFHEIRSLGARLKQNAGCPKEAINALLGHTTLKMTDVYLEDGSIKWTDAVPANSA